MVAIEKGAIMHEMVKRADNWPAKNAGVMVVFCIVFVVFAAVVGIYVHKALQRRKLAREAKAAL